MAKTLGKTTFLKNLWKKSPELVSGIFQARSIVLVGGKGQVGGGGGGGGGGGEDVQIKSNFLSSL